MAEVTLGEASQSRRNNFNFLRFMLASLVILTHSFNLLHRDNETLAFLTRKQLTLGTMSVDFFFVISGFLIANSWENRKTVLDYLRNRILRIYPGYVVAVMASVFIFGLLASSSPSAYLHSISAGHFLMDIIRLHKIQWLPSYAHNPEPGILNGSLWSIAIEFECYILLMVAGWIGLLRRRELMLAFFAISLLLSLGFLYSVPGIHQLVARLPDAIVQKLLVVTCFLSGTTLFLYRDEIRLSPFLLRFSVAVLILTAMTTGFVLATMVVGAYVLFYVAFSPKVKLNDWGKKIDLSYGIYLYGWPIQQLTIFYLGKSLNPYILTLIALPLACFCAALSWFCIEHPFLRMKKTGSRKK
jgi:peptidoglycan/LPS O-acetylase OafA/YrhL